MTDEIITIHTMSEPPHENFDQLERNFFRMQLCVMAWEEKLKKINKFVRSCNDEGENYMFLTKYDQNALKVYYGLRDLLIDERDILTKVIETRF